jgi:hypothetical protein
MGTTGLDGLSKALGIPIAALGSLLSGLTGSGTPGGAGSGLTSALNPGLYPLADGGSMYIAEDGTRVITQGDGTVSAYDKDGNSLGGTTNAGEGGNPNLNDQTLINQEANQTNPTQDQLDQYQNYYDTPAGTDTSGIDTSGGIDYSGVDTSGGVDYSGVDTGGGGGGLDTSGDAYA